MSDSVTLEYGAGQFSTSPKFAPYDMVMLNLDENNYISSPGAKILEVTDSTSMTDTAKSYAYTGSEREYTTNKWYSYSGSAWVAGSNYTPWANRNNGTYTFTWTESQSKWRYQFNGSGSTYYTTEQIYSNFAIDIHFAAVTGFTDAPKAGDVITVVLIKTTDSNVNEKQNVSINCTLTRSGSCMEADSPLVKPAERQAVADNLLQELYGYEYQPYQATTAHIDPAAELGDAIHAYGYYSGIYSQELTFDSMMASDIGAPCEEEVDNELEYESSTDRNYKRKFADIAAEFLIKADEISARVTKEGSGDGFSWSLVYDSWTVKKGNTEILKVDSDGLHVTGDGTFTGTIYASAGEFTGDIKGGTIHIGDNFSVDRSGNMSASNASFSGSISGSTITGGTINIGNGNFTVDSNGNLHAATGSFTGSVYASNILYGATGGYFNGAGITSASLASDRMVQAVVDRLGWANDYNNATGQNTSNYPTYFSAGNLVGRTSISCAGTISGKFSGTQYKALDSNGDLRCNLEEHYHSFTESGGKIYIGKPQISQGNFSIAATQTYKDGIAAEKATWKPTSLSISSTGASNNTVYNISVTAYNAAGTSLITQGTTTDRTVYTQGYRDCESEFSTTTAYSRGSWVSGHYKVGNYCSDTLYVYRDGYYYQVLDTLYFLGDYVDGYYPCGSSGTYYTRK